MSLTDNLCIFTKDYVYTGVNMVYNNIIFSGLLQGFCKFHLFRIPSLFKGVYIEYVLFHAGNYVL